MGNIITKLTLNMNLNPFTLIYLNLKICDLYWKYKNLLPPVFTIRIEKAYDLVMKYVSW